MPNEYSVPGVSPLHCSSKPEIQLLLNIEKGKKIHFYIHHFPSHFAFSS